MAHPCEQAEDIAELRVATQNVAITLARMERGQEKVVELLTQVANQDVRINHLETFSERTYTEINELFTRMREAEMNIAASGPTVRQQFHEAMDVVNAKLDTLERYVKIMSSKPALFVMALITFCIAAGTILDIIYHYEAFKAIYHFIRGG